MPITAGSLPPAAEPLDSSLRGDAAAKAILLRLLDALDANEAGVLRNEDPEYLHDFRIAVRRSRSALGQIKGVLPASSVWRFALRLRWLGQITGPPRDLDVYLLDFDTLKAGLPEPFQDSLEPLRGVLQSHADLAHAELSRQLHSRAYRKLLADWRTFLSRPCPQHPAAAYALTPVKTLADQRIWALFRRLLKHGRAITAISPVENLHDLRKNGKKLRYLLEFFRNLYPPDAIAAPIKRLKKLQDYLGELQDLHTRIDWLRRSSDGLRQDANIPTETLLAMGMLLAVLNCRQAQLREEYPKYFGKFADARNRAQFRELFKPDDDEAGNR